MIDIIKLLESLNLHCDYCSYYRTCNNKIVNERGHKEENLTFCSKFKDEEDK